MGITNKKRGEETPPISRVGSSLRGRAKTLIHNRKDQSEREERRDDASCRRTAHSTHTTQSDSVNWIFHQAIIHARLNGSTQTHSKKEDNQPTAAPPPPLSSLALLVPFFHFISFHFLSAKNKRLFSEINRRSDRSKNVHSPRTYCIASGPSKLFWLWELIDRSPFSLLIQMIPPYIYSQVPINLLRKKKDRQFWMGGDDDGDAIIMEPVGDWAKMGFLIHVKSPPASTTTCNTWNRDQLNDDVTFPMNSVTTKRVGGRLRQST